MTEGIHRESVSFRWDRGTNELVVTARDQNTSDQVVEDIKRAVLGKEVGRERRIKRDYYAADGSGHRPYQNILHSEDDRMGDRWEEPDISGWPQFLLNEVPDGHMVEIVVIDHGMSEPGEAFRWELTEAHKYGPVPRDTTDYTASATEPASEYGGKQ